MDQWSNFPRGRAEDLIRESTQFSGPFLWEQLYGDGSERVFHRVSDHKGSLVVVWSPPKDQRFPNENDSYLYVGRHLRQKHESG